MNASATVARHSSSSAKRREPAAASVLLDTLERVKHWSPCGEGALSDADHAIRQVREALLRVSSTSGDPVLAAFAKLFAKLETLDLEGVSGSFDEMAKELEVAQEERDDALADVEAFRDAARAVVGKEGGA